MASKNWYVVSYDITEPKRWKRVYERLHGYGTRLQYSIFRCRLTRTEIERLRWELEKELTEEDKLLILTICDNCEKRIFALNRPESWKGKDKSFDFA